MRRNSSFVLGIIVIALTLTTVFVLSFVPNPLVKNRPWVSVEDISFYQESSYDFMGNLEGTALNSLLIIVIHNPTHGTPTYILRDVLLDADISYISGKFHYTASGTGFQILKGGNWTNPITSVELTACSPSVVGLTLSSYESSFPSLKSLDTGTLNLHLTLDVRTLDGLPTSFTADWTANLVSTPLQTNATTTEVSTPPNECLFPWV